MRAVVYWLVLLCVFLTQTPTGTATHTVPCVVFVLLWTSQLFLLTHWTNHSWSTLTTLSSMELLEFTAQLFSYFEIRLWENVFCWIILLTRGKPSYSASPFKHTPPNSVWLKINQCFNLFDWGHTISSITPPSLPGSTVITRPFTERRSCHTVTLIISELREWWKSNSVTKASPQVCGWWR